MELHQSDREDRLEVRLHAIDVDTEGFERALTLEVAEHASREERLKSHRRLAVRHRRVVVLHESFALALADRRVEQASNALHSSFHVLLSDLRLSAELLDLLRTDGRRDLIAMERFIRNQCLNTSDALGARDVKLATPCLHCSTDLLHRSHVLSGQRLLGLKALIDSAEEFLNLSCHCLISVLLRIEDLTVFGSLMQASTIPLMVSMLRQCNQKRFNADSVSTS